MEFWTLSSKNPSYLSRHKVVDLKTGENYIKDIEFNFIELPKFNKKENQLKSIIDQWIYFIKNAESLAIIPENLKDEGLKFAYQDATKHNWAKLELEAYDYVFMREQDERGKISFALRQGLEQGIKEGIKEGIEKGIEKGIKQGLEQGIEKGIKEGLEQGIREEKENIAINLISFGLANNDIAKTTGLTIKQIENLRNKN